MDNFNLVPYIHHILYRKTYHGWSIPTRTISDHELVLIVSGEGKIKIRGKVITARPGMLFHFAPGVPHSLETESENPMGFYAVHFDMFTFIPGNIPELFHPDIDEITTPADFSVLKSLFKNMTELKISGTYGYKLGCSSILGEILFRLMSSNSNYGFSRKAEQIIGYIDNNLDKKLTLSAIAKAFSMNGSYLSKLFKSATGYTLTEYIQKARVNKAKEFIIEGNMKMQDIAAFAGYDDPLYFSRVFKKLEGVSPTEYYKRFITHSDAL